MKKTILLTLFIAIMLISSVFASIEIIDGRPVQTSSAFFLTGLGTGSATTTTGDIIFDGNFQLTGLTTNQGYVNDHYLSMCKTSSQTVARYFGEVGWGAYGSCKGWMNYWKCDTWETTNGGECLGDIDDSNNIDCYKDSDCNSNQYCHVTGECLESDCKNGILSCDDGIVYLCENNEWVRKVECYLNAGKKHECKSPIPTTLPITNDGADYSYVCKEDKTEPQITTDRCTYNSDCNDKEICYKSTLCILDPNQDSSLGCDSDFDCDTYEVCDISSSLCIVNPEIRQTDDTIDEQEQKDEIINQLTSIGEECIDDIKYICSDKTEITTLECVRGFLEPTDKVCDGLNSEQLQEEAKKIAEESKKKKEQGFIMNNIGFIVGGIIILVATIIAILSKNKGKSKMTKRKKKR